LWLGYSCNFARQIYDDFLFYSPLVASDSTWPAATVVFKASNRNGYSMHKKF
jgi:hypothetical protein